MSAAESTGGAKALPLRLIAPDNRPEIPLHTNGSERIAELESAVQTN